MHENNQLRVLVVTSTFPRWENDTIPSFIFELCQHLTKSGINIDVVAPHTRGAKKHEIIDGINVYRFQYFFNNWQRLSYSGGILSNLKKSRFNYLLIPFFLFAQLHYIYKCVKTGNYDLVHAHWVIPQGFICAVVNKLLGKDAIPILCTAHGSDLVSLKGPLALKLKNWTLANIEKVSLVSKSLKKYLNGLSVAEKNIDICPMGIDFNSTFFSTAGINRDPDKLIYVGRLIKSKGVKYLLEALKIVKDEYTKITLDIIGDGPDREELVMLSKDLNLSESVNFIGAINRASLPGYYSRATIALVPSTVQEGFGLVTVEAMACDCAVIVSDFESSREIIMPRVNGLLSVPANSIDIANNIKSLLSNKALLEEIVKNARNSVIDRFDWPIVANRYSEIICRAVDE